MVAREAAKLPLLLVDDDPLIAETLAFFLGGEFEVVAAATRPEALERVRGLASIPGLALVDLGLPPLPHRPDEGFALVTDLLALAPSMAIVVLSGQNDEDNARHARALGAVEFVAKPADPEKLRNLLRSLHAGAAGGTPAVDLLGRSPAMEKLQAQLRQYARAPFPVLIEGESGSGKELVAHALHRLSDRVGKPFLALNCAAISPNLVEPTLFGHARGAFTGAAVSRSGYFEDAAEGMLFLDEIGELPLELQPKLLRVLENGAYQRVGETQERVSRARIIAATNRDLRQEVRQGRFRADLYHRLSVLTVVVPPLREMADDRFLLLDHFSQTYAHQAGIQPFRLSPEASHRWRNYAFPGNVRELRNIVIRLGAKYGDRLVSRTELEFELDPTAAAGQPAGDNADALLEVAMGHLRKASRFSLDQTLRQWETAYIDAAQRLTQGNITQAAKMLGLSRTTLYNRIDALTRDKALPPRSGT